MDARSLGIWSKWNGWPISQRHLFIGHQPTLCITAKFARGLSRSRRAGHMRNIGSPYKDKGRIKALLISSQLKKAGDLLILNRNRLRMMTGFIIGHCHLKEHLFKLGLVKKSRVWKMKAGVRNSLTLSLRLWGLTTLIFRQMDRHFMKPPTLKTSLSARYCTLFEARDC